MSNSSNKYGYVQRQQKQMLLNILEIVGFSGFNENVWVSFAQIVSDPVRERVTQMMEALRTVFKTKQIRSMVSKRSQDKRFVLNLLRQLLHFHGYQLRSKNYHLAKEQRITSSTKYSIIATAAAAFVIETETPDSLSKK